MRVAGRVRRKHALGDKLFFYDLVQGACDAHERAMRVANGQSSPGTSQVQVLVNMADYKPSADQLDFAKINEVLRRGDIVGVVGHPGSSNTGELSILAVSACRRDATAGRVC